MASVNESWPLVGRDKDLERIVAALGSPASAGVVLVGPGGVGKTRLAREALRFAESAGFATESVLATRSAATVPLGAFAPLLASGRAGAPGDPTGDGQVEPRGDALRSARDALLGLTDPAPLVLFVDDAHLLDPVSAALLAQVAHAERVCVLATLRRGERPPDSVTAMWKDGGATRIDLEPLGREQTELLLREALGGRLTMATLQMLWERSAGNPLALRELVTGSVERGVLKSDGGLWHLMEPPPLTTRLTELVGERLGGLGGQGRRAIAWAALGAPVSLEMLVRMAGSALVGQLEERGVLEVTPGPAGDEVRPAHPLYGEVVLEQLGTLARRELLTELADTQEAEGLHSATDVLRVASWRLAAGGPVEPDLLLSAAHVAYAREDYPRTAELASRAWEQQPSAAAGYLLGFCLGREGRPEEADRVLTGAADLATDDRTRVLVALGRAENRFRGLADAPGALAINEAAEASVTGADQRAELVASRAMFVMMQGRCGDALDLLGPLLADTASERPFVKAAYAAGPALAHDGQTGQALDLATRALPVHERVWAADLFQTEPAVHHVTAILAHLEAGQLEHASGYAQVALETATATGTPYAIGFMALLVGQVETRRGKVQDAVARFREAAVAFGESGYPGPRRWALAGAALGSALRGDLGEATALLAEVHELATRTPVRFNEGQVDGARAWTLLAAGEPVAARRLLSEAADRATAARQRAIAAELLHSLAQAGAAEQALERLEVLACELDGELLELRVAHVRASARMDAAALDEASLGFDRIGAGLHAAQAAAEAAHAHRRSGRSRDATRSADRARDLLSRCQGATTPAFAGLSEPAVLTRREREVSILAASGLASREIAERLRVSRRTVDNHLQRAYDKLGVRSRRDLASLFGPEGATPLGGSELRD